MSGAEEDATVVAEIPAEKEAVEEGRLANIGGSDGVSVDENTDDVGNSSRGPEPSVSGKISASGEISDGLGEKDMEDDEEDEGGEKEEEGQEQELVGIASNEAKNIILQVLSPYFEDDGSEGGEEDDTAQRYDHIKCKDWIQLICDGILERLVGLGKPYKYVAHCMIMRKCGAGMHVCSSCYYGAGDGWVSHAHDLSAHIYAVVTVYWLAI